jgi:hypothetical protein
MPKLLWKEAAGIYNRARGQRSVRGLEEGRERIGLPLPACPAEWVTWRATGGI